MKIEVSIFSFWDTPHELDYIGISDYNRCLAMWSDGQMYFDVDGVEVEPKPEDKIWDDLFSIVNRLDCYTPTKVITSGGADITHYEIEL